MRRRWADFGSDSEDDLWPMPPSPPRRVSRQRPPLCVRRAGAVPCSAQYFLAAVPTNLQLQMCVINLFVEVAYNGGPSLSNLQIVAPQQHRQAQAQSQASRAC